MADTKFQTSFIPKQPVTEAPKRSSGSSVFFLIGFLLLVATTAAGVGAFIWQKTITAQIQKGEKQLEDHKSSFDSNSIAQFTKLDSRIDVAQELLKNHLQVSAIFPKIQNATLKTVRFKNFTYVNDGGKILISMSGEAKDYEDMALQAKEFTDPNLPNSFQSPIFSNFSKVKDIVVFTFSSGIDPYVIQYYQNRQNAIKEASAGSPTLPAATN